ncbi:MAG: tRNA (adenosine(37)-N6)-threonylcarbamoyltransferase complex dimerization subunit type 1 TsaB [Oscillospiraceae bacterium]|nr:tRNA (adenosine(37)-N6)-threonylcarbamoyltransferase complex dimerization subunit type 1 TsaB [Oscillospiraceae bacterium]
MKLLAMEAASVSGSAAVREEDKLLALSFRNRGLTHSQTLLPMVEEVLDAAGMKITDLDGIAFTDGPGSFTGLRIGGAAVKGLFFGRKACCYPVSSLLAAACGGIAFSGIVSASMDARCGQVYNALFRGDGKTLTRLTADRALPVAELLEELRALEGTPILHLGDGGHIVFGEAVAAGQTDQILAPAGMRYPTAAGVAEAVFSGLAAADAEREGYSFPLDPEQLELRYLRKPQAEREREAREGRTPAKPE